MANFGPSKTWTDGEILSHTDLNAALLDIINNVTNNNIDADNIDETDDYTWSGANSFTGGHSIKVLSNAASSIVTGTTLEWDPSDGGQMTDNSSGISLDFKLPDASDNQDIFASIATICLDDAAGSEDGELSFRVATAGTNTEQMTLSSTALTVTPAITASGGVSGSVTSSNATITGGTITGITDIAVADGGTGASTAAAARTNLGLEIGVDVQAYDAELQALSGLTPTDGNIIVGNGSTFVTESGATARTSLGLGSIATQNANAVSITGGSLTGMTSYSGGTISGTTATLTGGLTGTTATFSGLISGNGGAEIGSNTAKVKFYSDSTYSGIYNGSSLVSDESYYFGNGDHFWYSDGSVAMKIDNGDLAVDTDTLYVDASNARVGIGTASPATLAHLYSNSSGSNTELRIEHNDASSTPTATMRFKRAGADFAYVGGAAAAISGASTTDLGLTVPSGKNIVFGTNNTERARIDSSGNLLIGYTSSNGSYKLQVNSQIFATNATIATSDGRYKEDVQTLSNATDLVSRLNPVQFKWKAHETHNFDVGKTDVGFIAQEVQAVLSDTDYSDSVVVTNKTDDEEFLGLGETKLIPLLTAALQEAITKIETLETKVAALEAA